MSISSTSRCESNVVVEAISLPALHVRDIFIHIYTNIQSLGSVAALRLFGFGSQIKKIKTLISILLLSNSQPLTVMASRPVRPWGLICLWSADSSWRGHRLQEVKLCLWRHKNPTKTLAHSYIRMQEYVLSLLCSYSQMCFSISATMMNTITCPAYRIPVFLFSTRRLESSMFLQISSK